MIAAAACAGAGTVPPSPGAGAVSPAESSTVPSAPADPGDDAGSTPDAAVDAIVSVVDAPDGAADAAPDVAKVVCSDSDGWLPYKVDLGPNENSAAMGPHAKSESDEGPPIRVTLTALSAPKELDVSFFATYLPYYLAMAYQEAASARPGLRGTVRIGLVLDETGKATKVELQAPGFPAAFKDDVRERAATTYVICPPLPPAAKLSATFKLEPRRLRKPGGH